MKNNNVLLQILVNVLSIFGGLVLTALMLLLLFLFNALLSSAMQLVFGIGLCAVVIFTSRTKVNILLDAMLIALYFAGLCILAIFFSDWVEEWYLVGLPMAVVGAITFATAKKSILLFISVVMFNFALLLLVVGILEVPSLEIMFLMGWIIVLFAVNHFEADIIVKYKMPYLHYKALQGGLFATIVLGIFLSLHHMFSQVFYLDLPETPWCDLFYIIVPVAFVLMMFKIMERLEVQPSRHTPYAALLFIVVGALTFWSPYLGTSLLLAAMAWYYGYRIQATVAAICTAYYIIRSYYDMDLSLLTKSAILFFNGAILLVVWALYMKKKKKRYEQI